MQNQLHTLDPALRSNPISSSPRVQSHSRYHDTVSAPNYSPIQPSPGNSYQSIQTPSYYGQNHQPRESPDDQSPTASNAHDPNDLKRPRACEACRQLKVKCEFDESTNSGSCKRCAKANRQCIVTVPSRKRQKKTDSRVAELEKKIDALTASLAARGGHDSDIALDPAIAQSQYQHQAPIHPEQWPSSSNNHGQVLVTRSPGLNQVAGAKRKHHDDIFGGELRQTTNGSNGRPTSITTQVAYNETRQMSSNEETTFKDVVDQGIIDSKAARQCFDRYNQEMCQQLPIVVFPPGTHADDIRKSKPILFTAIVGVASGTIRPDLQSRLIGEATKTLAERIVYNGEKSLELVQAIQVMTVFYQPPERYEELNFNQLIHIAAVMALDIGMGKRIKKGTFAMWRGYMDKSKVPDPYAAETRRCWLGCYYMCSNSAMSLRRPLLVRWSPYADECIEILHTAPDVLPTDKVLCYAVKAQRIAEYVGRQFFMDDPVKEVSLTDPHVQEQLEKLEKDLSQLRQEASPEMSKSAPLQHTEAIVNLYMHEIAMHNEHNVDDFRPPYHATPIEGPPDPESVTEIHVKSLTTCLKSAHAAFDAFLSMDVNLLRSLPTHFFVRTSYAAVALIKMYTAIAAKGSKFGAFFKPDDLKVDHYLDRLISTVTKVAEGGMSKVAYKFSLIFTMLKSWHVRRIGSPSERGSREQSQQRALSRNTTSHATGYSTQPPQQQQQEYGQSQQQQHRKASLWSQSENRNDARAMRQNHQPTYQPNGLQMLSDAAMAPDSHQNRQGPWISSHGGLPQINTASQQIGNNNSIPMQPNLGANSMGVMPADPGTLAMAGIYGLPSDQIALMDFTSDELMAYGFGDEFMAMNFGFDQSAPLPPSGQGGWAI